MSPAGQKQTERSEVGERAEQRFTNVRTYVTSLRIVPFSVSSVQKWYLSLMLVRVADFVSPDGFHLAFCHVYQLHASIRSWSSSQA